VDDDCGFACGIVPSNPSAVASFREKQKQGSRSMATQFQYFPILSFDVSRFFSIRSRVSFEWSVEMQSYEFDMPEAKKID